MRRWTYLMLFALPPAPIAAGAQQQVIAPDQPVIEDSALPIIPWQAQIYSGNTQWTPADLAKRSGWDLAHKCGGSLIAPGWVLTAAHCINAERIKNGHRVRLGASTINLGQGATYRIDRMVRHADYDNKRKVYDVALVHYVADALTREEGAGPIAPIALYDGPPLEPGVAVTASGWGKAEEGKDKGFSAELSTVDMTVVDCAAIPILKGWTKDYHLCANAPDDDTCEGDSGGPLVMTEGAPVLVGVINFGFGCYRAERAGVYLRIDRDNFRDWIRRAMAADPSVSDLR